MKRLVVGAISAYLTIGLAFSTATQPEQTWTCPDASQPHGTITYGGLDEAPEDGCWPRVGTADRVQWIAFATPVWLPLGVAKGLSGD